MRLLGFVIVLGTIIPEADAQTTADSQKDTDTIPQDSVFSHVLEYELPDHSPLSSIPNHNVAIYPNITTYFTGSGGDYGWCLNKPQLQYGREFLKKHSELLKSVEDSLGPDPRTIVAIFRVETQFGTNTETHQVLGAVISILHYLDDEDWEKWAKDQLQALPKASEILNTDITDLRGSYAGAVGYPQFLPTSVPAYAVDGSGDGSIDLSNLEDAIWSIGNYLHKNGWKDGRRKAVLAYNPSSDYADCVFAYRRALH